MKLVLRPGGRVENRDPFKRNPSGLRLESSVTVSQDQFKAKEMMTLSAVAQSVSRVSRTLPREDRE